MGGTIVCGGRAAVLLLAGCSDPSPSGDGSTLERARREGSIRIGFADEAPFAYLDTQRNRVSGEAPEVARVILRRLGIEKVQGVLTEFGSLIPGLEAGRFDLIAAGMDILPERCERIAFSNPTYAARQAFIVKQGNPLVLPLFGLNLSAMAVGILVLALNTGAYGAEVVRGAILAVPRGQREAAAALNMSRMQTYIRVVIPQAIPPVVPALGNYLIAMFKDTPLLSAITVLELLQTAKVIGAETFRYTEPLTLVGVLFLAVSLVAAAGVRALERRLAAALGRTG